MARDNWAALYGRYSVTKMTVSGTISCRGVSNDEDVYVFIQSDVNANILPPIDDATTTYHNRLESGRYKIKTFRVAAAPAAFPSGQVRRFSYTVFPKRLVTARFVNADNPDGWADQNEDPVYDDTLGAVAVPNLVFWATDGERRVAGFPFMVIDCMCQYHVKMSDPVTLGQS